MTDHIVFEKKGGIGHILLNRPEALNALTGEMIDAMDAALDECAADEDVKLVLVTSASEKAFCAGGDIKAMAEEAKAVHDGKAETGSYVDFFRREYALNTKIKRFEKPYVSIIDGLCMGGGVGISMHGSYRLVTENARFAMPEVKIGFFPDVGGGFLLSNMSGAMGTYLALTARTIKGADMMALGLGTHFMERPCIPHLIDNLLSLDWSRSDVSSVLQATLSNYCEDQVPSSDLMSEKGKIDDVFKGAPLDEALSTLRDAGDDWHSDTLKTIEGMCPLSVRVAFDHVQNSVGLEFEEVMIAEYRISQYMILQPDFYEGVRALLIDKDNNPQWSSDLTALPNDLYQKIQDEFSGEDLTFTEE